MTFKCYDIRWDYDGKRPHLPKVITVQAPFDISEDSEELEEYLSDYITDATGFCHCGFKCKVA